MGNVAGELLAIALYESRARSLGFLGKHKRAWLDIDSWERDEWRQEASKIFQEEI